MTATSEHWRLPHAEAPRECDAKGCTHMALWGHVVRGDARRWNVARCQVHHDLLLDRIARGVLLLPAVESTRSVTEPVADVDRKSSASNH